ncbi:MAG TPA: hypothetical protein VF815_40605 [Myxococcaceae bacterium]|jgi:hypothetical protein
MIKKETAVKVLLLAREASAKLNESIKIVQVSEPSESFEHYRAAAGQALGELYFSIIEPILTQHPDLTPPGLQTGSDPTSKKR